MKPKQRILKTASELFHRQGYRSTGVNQIIDEANVAKASFYSHFPSKEVLCAEFLHHRHSFWFEQLELFTKNAVHPKSKVLSSFDFLVSMNTAENFRGCSFLNTLSEISNENRILLEIIQNHKKDLKNYFLGIIGDIDLSEHIYLLFESCIIESQLTKSNEIIYKTKTIIKTIL